MVGSSAEGGRLSPDIVCLRSTTRKPAGLSSSPATRRPKLGSRVIESEHVLLGILREGEETVLELMARFNVKPEDLRREIEGERVFVERVSSTAELPLSEETKKVLAYAAHEAESMLHKAVGSEHLIIGLLRVDNCLAQRILLHSGLDLAMVREEVVSIAREREASLQKKELPFLTEYGRDLTALASQGTFDPLIGRDQELERIIQVLSRRTKNNPILLGEPGVGKTAIVEGLAQRIVGDSVPIFLRAKRIIALDLSLIVAGTKYRGQFEERLKGILKELKESDNLVVFIDEIHSLIGAGSAEGSLDAANILKPSLSRGEVACIGATTLREYRKYIEKGPLTAAPFPGRPGRSADLRGDLPDPVRHPGALRGLSQGALRGPGAARRGRPDRSLHARPLSARQGDRRHRRGGGQGQAAAGARHPEPAPSRGRGARGRTRDEVGDLRQGLRTCRLPAGTRNSSSARTSSA